MKCQQCKDTEWIPCDRCSALAFPHVDSEDETDELDCDCQFAAGQMPCDSMVHSPLPPFNPPRIVQGG